MQTFNEWLASMNIDPAVLTDDRRTTLENAWRAENGDADPATATAAATVPGDSRPMIQDTTYQDFLNKRRADGARQKAITDACSEMMNVRLEKTEEIEEVRVLAISQGWTIERTQLELVRRFERANVNLPSPSSRSPALDSKVLEAAVLKGSGFLGLEKAYDERTLSRMDTQFGNRGLSIGELLTLSARQRGWRGHSYTGDLRNVLEFAFGRAGHGPMAAGGGGSPSTISLPTIFSNVANKQAKFYFEQVDQSWRMISAIGSARNFQQTTDVALTGSLLLQDLPKGGEIKHGTLGEKSYTNQLETVALQLGLSRVDLINDDAGALDSRTRRMSRGAALKFNKDFWETFLGASSAFFDASLGNAGSSTLDIAGLGTANTLFKNLTDPDGQFMGSTAKILLVGTGLEPTAKQLMSSTMLNHTGDTDAAFGADNPWAGMFTVVSNPYVSSTTYGGASTRWYLLADPQDIPTIETKFLNGNQSPTIESTDMNWDQLGISMRIYFDYGIALQEYRGGVKEN